MGNIAASVLAYAFVLILPWYVVATWISWFSNKTKPIESRWGRWRRSITVLGFALASVSLLIINALAVHAFITGGLPYHHPFWCSLSVWDFSAHYSACSLRSWEPVSSKIRQLLFRVCAC